MVLSQIVNLILSIEPRIIGGHKVDIVDYPHAVTFFYHNSSSARSHYSCGGSIINPLWVVSVAHCHDDVDQLNVTIVFGLDEYTHPPPVENTRSHVKRIIHESYGHRDQNDHDIVLLKLNKPIPKTKKSRPIRIPYKNEPIDKLTATGFIGDRFGVRKLYAMDINLLGVQNCNVHSLWEQKSVLCGAWNVTNHPYQGDSGSGLISSNKNGEKVLVGMVQRGLDANKERTIFLKIEYFSDWIQKTMNEHFDHNRERNPGSSCSGEP